MEYTIENYNNAKKNDVFDFVCQKCGKNFTKTKRQIQQNKNIPPKCCSKTCGRSLSDLGEIEVTCAECGNTKKIKVSEYNKSDNKIFFCNRSCSTKYHNKQSPKRKKDENKICPVCGGRKSKQSVICSECEKNRRKDILRNTPIGKYIGYTNKKSYLARECSVIRKDARLVLVESKKPCECEVCHDKELEPILEVHHIKQITDFSPETLISEVNDLSNLMWLCPNHHKLVHLGIIHV